MRILATVLMFAISSAALGQDQASCNKQLKTQLTETTVLVGTGLAEAKFSLFFNVIPCKMAGDCDSPEIFVTFFEIEIDEKIIELQRQKITAFKAYFVEAAPLKNDPCASLTILSDAAARVQSLHTLQLERYKQLTDQLLPSSLKRIPTETQ